jgi:DNA polymerase-3 subunit beta
MISIPKEHLVPAMRHLLRTTPRKPILAVLSCVKIAPVQGAILLTSTDLDRETTISIPAPKPIGLAAKLAANRAVPVVVPADVLANCAKSADPESAIHIAPASITFSIGGQASTVPVRGYNAEDFPDSPQETEHHLGVCFDTDKIKRLLRCVSTDEARYVLNGIYWDGEGYLIATDGRRLHKESTESTCPFQLGEHKGVIIPTAACKLIPERAAISLLAKEEDPPRFIAFTAHQGILTIRILSKLVEGNYPNYRQVIPEASGNSVRFDNTQAAATLRKLAPKGSTTLITPFPTGVTFSVRDKDSNPCGAFTQPAILKGNPCRATYDTKFLIAALENGGDCIDARDSLSPGLLTGIKGNTHVIMPIRTTEPATPCEKQEEEPCAA